jgi:hypothetical protein
MAFTSKSTGARRVRDGLERAGVQNPRLVLHSHDDHAGGIEWVCRRTLAVFVPFRATLRSMRPGVRAVWLAGVNARDRDERQARGRAATGGTPVHRGIGGVEADRPAALPEGEGGQRRGLPGAGPSARPRPDRAVRAAGGGAALVAGAVRQGGDGVLERDPVRDAAAARWATPGGDRRTGPGRARQATPAGRVRRLPAARTTGTASPACTVPGCPRRPFAGRSNTAARRQGQAKALSGSPAGIGGGRMAVLARRPRRWT